MENTYLSDILRSIAEVLLNPVLIILLIFMATTLVMLGSLIIEVITEARRLNKAFPSLAKKIEEWLGTKNDLENNLGDDLKAKKSLTDLKATIESSRILRRQKDALLKLVTEQRLTAAMRESYAARAIEHERATLDRITYITDVIARLGPAFGLIATLIPLGPGVVALGNGDTATLSSAMLTAFDATVAGLISSGIAFVVSGIRKRIYASQLSSYEMITEMVLEVMDAHS